MSIREAIIEAARALAKGNVQPNEHYIELSDLQFDSLRRDLSGDDSQTLGAGHKNMLLNTPYGNVEVHRVRMRSRTDDSVTLPLSELRDALEPLEILAGTMFGDNERVSVLMSTLRRCAELLRAAESAHILGAALDRNDLETIAGARLDAYARAIGITRINDQSGLESDYLLRRRLEATMRKGP